jgi:hypothetical protein
VCGEGGIKDKLYERGRCACCALTRRTAELLAGQGPRVPAALVPVAEAIAAAPVPGSALNWPRRGAGAGTHETLDTHPRPRAADSLRRMRVAYGVLPDRDEDLARTQRWVADLLAAIKRPADRRLVAAYATWRMLRRLRRRAGRNPGLGPPPATPQPRSSRGRRARLARRARPASGRRRPRDIDAWLATRPGAYHARDFLGWASDHGHSQTLSTPDAVRRTATTLDPHARWAVLARLLHEDGIDLTDRVAGCLVLLYAQQLSRITAMTVEQVTRRDDTVSIRLGSDHIAVPEPLAGLIRAFIDTPRSHISVGSPQPSRWLFPGHLPGRPLTPARLGARLAKHGIHARAGRRAALIHHPAQLPAAVLADLLHLSAGTTVGWVNNTGGDRSRHPAALARKRSHQQKE